MIRWNLASKNDSELWKFPIFDSSDSKSLTRYQKILWICSLGYKNLLNFAWHSTKFYNCHHANAGPLDPWNYTVFQKGHENGVIFNNLQKKTSSCHVFQFENEFSDELHLWNWVLEFSNELLMLEIWSFCGNNQWLR